MFGWWKTRRRRKLTQQPFPTEWGDALRQNVGHYAWLSDAERTHLHATIQVLCAEKNWEGCNGIELTDEIRVTIAGQAAILTLGFDDEFFERLITILVYPGQYVAPEKRALAGGGVIDDFSERLGEAWSGGVVVLSWPDVLQGGVAPTDGRNVVMHEFAHVLDGSDHYFDGIPERLPADQYDAWREVTGFEHRQLVRAAQEGRWTLIDRYGAKNPAEFFAVATECFFEKPHQMQHRHARLYDVLCGFYRQNPAERVPAVP